MADYRIPIPVWLEANPIPAREDWVKDVVAGEAMCRATFQREIVVTVRELK